MGFWGFLFFLVKGLLWLTVPALVALRDATDAILRALSEERGTIPRGSRMAPVKAG